MGPVGPTKVVQGSDSWGKNHKHLRDLQTKYKKKWSFQLIFDGVAQFYRQKWTQRRSESIVFPTHKNNIFWIKIMILSGIIFFTICYCPSGLIIVDSRAKTCAKKSMMKMCEHMWKYTKIYEIYMKICENLWTGNGIQEYYSLGN